MKIVELTTAALALTLILAACGGKDAGGGGEGGGETAGLAKSALVGSWSGPFGSFTLGEDDKGKLTLKNCGYEILGPGQIKMPEDVSTCEEKSYEGEVRLEGYEVAIGDPAKMMHKFSAYLDGAGALHLGMSVRQDVSPLKGKVGDVTVGMFDTLKVAADGTCTLSSKMEDGPKPAKCRFEKAGEVEVFVYEHKGEEEGMVYLAKEGLVVPANVHQMAFTKGK